MSTPDTGAEPPPYTFEILENGFWRITLADECSVDLARRLTREVREQIALGHPRGVLLDLTEHASVSMICLSNIVDQISRYLIPVAAVFTQQVQQYLARLIHYTLPYRDFIHYTDTFDDAWTFLHSFTPPDLPDSGGPYASR